MKERKSETGFTMIEVMIALVLTAVAVIGIVSLFMTQTNASAYSRHTTEATVLAEDKIEKLRTLGPAAAQSGTENNLDEKGVTGTGMFTRVWSETVSTNYADLLVTITWTENGVGKTVQLRGRRNL